MSVEENKALARRFFENGYQEVMRGNVDVAHEYFADHYHDHTSMHSEQPGVHGLKELIADAGQATPDMRIKVVDIAADEDVVFVHWQASGRHENQHQVNKHVRDIQPTGEEGSASGISLYRIEGGKFVEGWNYHNVLEYALGRGTAGTSGGSA